MKRESRSGTKRSQREIFDHAQSSWLTKAPKYKAGRKLTTSTKSPCNKFLLTPTTTKHSSQTQLIMNTIATVTPASQSIYNTPTKYAGNRNTTYIESSSCKRYSNVKRCDTDGRVLDHVLSKVGRYREPFHYCASHETRTSCSVISIARSIMTDNRIRRKNNPSKCIHLDQLESGVLDRDGYRVLDFNTFIYNIDAATDATILGSISAKVNQLHSDQNHFKNGVFGDRKTRLTITAAFPIVLGSIRKAFRFKSIICSSALLQVRYSVDFLQ